MAEVELGFTVEEREARLATVEGISVSGEADPEGPWAVAGPARESLDLLPLAIRFGTNDSGTTAWYRWGVRRRRLAHLLARELPPPEELNSEALADWIVAQRQLLFEDPDFLAGHNPAEPCIVEAFRQVER